MKTVYENYSIHVFPGFYYSLFDPDEYLDNKSFSELPDGYSFEFRQGGYDKYQTAICQAWVEGLRNLYSEDFEAINLKILDFKGLWSPDYYNFITDKISFGVEFNLTKLKNYCWKNHADRFHEYLQKTWSSRDGFWSFIPNTLDRFKEEYKEPAERGTLIDIMLEFYLLETVNFFDVNGYAYESVYVEDFVCLKDLQGNKWEYEWNDQEGLYTPSFLLEKKND